MFKKLFLFLALILIAGIAKASWWDDRPDQYTVVYTSATAASVSTTVVMVPLSSTTWSHPTDARAIIVDSIQLDLDKAAATTSVIKIGVVREVNTSSGTIVWFEQMGNAFNVSNTNDFQYVIYPDGGLNCRVNSRTPNFGPNLGTTPYILSNNTLQSALINSAIPLPSVVQTDGTPIALPRVGDIVLNIVDGAAVATFSCTIRYHIDKN